MRRAPFQRRVALVRRAVRHGLRRPKPPPVPAQTAPRGARTPTTPRPKTPVRMASTSMAVVDGNRLAGPSGVAATGSPLSKLHLPWPEAIKAAFAISMRAVRWRGLQARLGPWAPRVQHFPATNGAILDLAAYKASGRLHPTSVLRRGEIGCYESHVRIWERIVQQHIPLTLILEDDANLRHTERHAQAMRQALSEAEHVPGWHLLYLGHREEHDGPVYGSLVKPRTCQGLFGYLLTEEGARILLKHARPIQLPVDVLVAELHDRGTLRALAAMPRLFYVVPVHSDTAHIA